MKRTTLILGAGASFDIGYPTGDGLKSHILLTIKKGNGLYDMAMKADFSEDRISRFGIALAKSTTKTIDEFLLHRTDFIDIGRFAIAHELTMRENVPIEDRVENSWYLDLRRRLGSKLEYLKPSELRIITFNYDRSLEHFLFGAYDSLHPEHTDPRYIESSFKEKLFVGHVHGVLSPLTWQHINGRAYVLPTDAQQLLSISRGIVLPHEPAEFKLSDGRAPSAVIDESEQIFFLGFGYAESNLRKLGFLPGKSYPSQLIGGTTVGMEPEEIRAVHEYFPGFRPYNSISTVIKSLGSTAA
jgi:hypothetical protein